MQRDNEMGSSRGSYCVDCENGMEPEGTLPPSQEPVTCLYPEPDQSITFLPHPTS